MFRYKHRHWSMIIKEHKNKKCVSLWLTAVRGLEIWDILKTTKKKIYNDEKILRQVLCIIHFYFLRTKHLRCTSITKVWRRPAIIFQEKEYIENQIANFTREHRLANMQTPDTVSAIRPYVTPELMDKEVRFFFILLLSPSVQSWALCQHLATFNLIFLWNNKCSVEIKHLSSMPLLLCRVVIQLLH